MVRGFVADREDEPFGTFLEAGENKAFVRTVRGHASATESKDASFSAEVMGREQTRWC